MSKLRLDIGDMAGDPVEQFGRWYDEVPAAGENAREVCCLATATANGVPSARIVLLKGFDRRGFVIYTNYGSRKAAELDANPRAALTFHWPSAGRQVRVEGKVTRTSRQESKEYFITRPYESRLGAWTSRQSAGLESREQLIKEFERLKEQFPQEVPLPEFWGGYRIEPLSVEFWQQGDWRLHDRFRYNRPDGGVHWHIERLSP